MNATTLFKKTMPSPVGELTLVASEKGLVAVLWENDRPERVPMSEPLDGPDHEILMQAEKQLALYFSGDLQCFTVPLDFRGTAFQQQVWQQLLEIPFGETRSYGEIAERIGNPKSVRAVGAANGKNPISIIAPCHRVIGANGKLTGFAGGLEAKAYLLQLETAANVNAAQGQLL